MIDRLLAWLTPCVLLLQGMQAFELQASHWIHASVSLAALCGLHLLYFEHLQTCEAHLQDQLHKLGPFFFVSVALSKKCIQISSNNIHDHVAANNIARL